MNHDAFDKILKRRIEQMEKVLGKKAAEYAKGNDRLHNFKRAGAMLRSTPEAALVGMLAKHLISILDMVDDLDQAGFLAAAHLWDEKLGDAVNYLVLLEGLVAERHLEIFDRVEA
jgi:hypothetical protein